MGVHQVVRGRASTKHRTARRTRVVLISLEHSFVISAEVWNSLFLECTGHMNPGASGRLIHRSLINKFFFTGYTKDI